MKPAMSSANDTVYLCNFRVSVDGDWLCLKELHDLQTCEISSIAARSHYFKDDYGVSNDIVCLFCCLFFVLFV